MRYGQQFSNYILCASIVVAVVVVGSKDVEKKNGIVVTKGITKILTD